MADFRAIGDYETVLATIATGTVVEAGDLVEVDTGLIVKATATGAALAYAPQGSASGETEIEITKGNVELIGTSDAAFAVTDKGILCDLVGTTTLLIDIGASSTDVLKVAADINAGTATSADDVKVFINKPITF